MKKLKFKSAAEKRQYEENERTWKELNAKYESISKAKNRKVDSVFHYSLSNPVGRERVELPSVVTHGGDTAARESMTYSGDRVKGISIVHKSCLQPVFTDEQAKDFAGMRR
jgi:hypothetical protein